MKQARESLRQFFQDAAVFLVIAACWPFCALADVIAERRTKRRGIASWYGENYRGRIMANGRPFDPDRLTCAHRTLPLGSIIKVRKVSSPHYVWVTVTDRGPADERRIIDLSLRAFRSLERLETGLIEVELILPAEEDVPLGRLAMVGGAQ